MATTTETSAAKTAAPPTAGGLSHKQIMTILVGLLLGLLLAALDQTIVSTAIRVIGDDLHGLNIQAWVTTAYLITSTVTTPLYGKLSDIYGRRPLFILAISLFIIGSFASAFATSMPMLAAFRAFQGIGAGGLFSLAFAVLADIVPPRERAKYQGYFLAVFGTSSVIGPLVGGFFAGSSTILGFTGWRWVFLVNVPIGIVALVVVWKFLHIPHIRRDHRIDWWGALALIVGIVPLLIVAEQANSWGWGSARILGLLALAVVGIVAFILIEVRMKDEALIPMRLFRNSTFSLSLGVNALIGLGMFGAISMLPFYLQLVKGATPTQSGLLLLPLMVGLMAGSIVSGQLTSKTGKYKIFPVIGTGILVVAFLLLLTVKTSSNYVMLDSYFLLVGLGLGLCMQTLLIAVQNAVPARDIGVATSSATFFRQLGGTLGVAIFLSLLFNGLPSKIGSAIQANSTNPAFQQALAASGHGDPSGAQKYLGGLGQQLVTDSSFLAKLNPAIALPFKQGFVSATHTVYLLAAIAMVLAFVLINLIKAAPLRTMSAIQERQVESASMAAETLPEGGVASPGASPAPEMTKGEMTKDEMHSGPSTTNDSSVGNDTSGDHVPAHSSETVSHPIAVADLVADSDLLTDGQTVGAGSDRGKHQA
jgi:EmrB/QacA subfamily drug resistance transporter